MKYYLQYLMILYLYYILFNKVTYIPIMSDQMLKYLETFLKLVEDVFRNVEILEDDEIFLIYVILIIILIVKNTKMKIKKEYF